MATEDRISDAEKSELVRLARDVGTKQRSFATAQLALQSYQASLEEKYDILPGDSISTQGRIQRTFVG